MRTEIKQLANPVNRSPHRASGFTLLEILLVMAVMVMATAVAVPSFHRSFTGQQLRAGADVVRARFSEARVKAIESGDIYGFFYSENGGDYFIAPMVQGFRSIQNGSNPAADEDILDNGIVFAAGDASQDSRSDLANQQATTQYSHMRPVLFYPDGTSQDAVIILQSPKTAKLIQIDLRGLTGTSAKSGLLNPDEISR